MSKEVYELKIIILLIILFYPPAASNPRRVRCGGRGLQATGVRVGDEADFTVTTRGAGDGDVTARVIGPGNLGSEVGGHWAWFSGRTTILVNYHVFIPEAVAAIFTGACVLRMNFETPSRTWMAYHLIGVGSSHLMMRSG